MKLFSKRNRQDRNSSFVNELRYSRFRARRREIIDAETRNRIAAEISYLSSSNNYLEWFILFENEKKGKIYFDTNKVDSFSLSELGYKMSDSFQFDDFKIIKHQVKSTGPEDDKYEYFDDYHLFDMAEITILFSQKDKRQDVINRFNLIFEEEASNFRIIEHLITKKSGETLKTLKSILKDDDLRQKISIYYDLYDAGDYVGSSKTSAEILNIIFSDFIKNKKTKAIESILERLSKKLLKSPTNEKKLSQLKSHLDAMLNISKTLNNDIYDIRHTERSTLRLSNDALYRLISEQNISLTELVITTLKDDYVLGDNWEKIKQEYIKKYEIDPKSRLILRKPEIVDVNDIPF
ncbi:TPA: hypothetical protein EYO12_01100 [Candidatus Saccharibacteria bacterium]|nr:hypothetical protein [Candidatus Saccharibacteria bacterium]HIO87315.1 hypothetical protein [Candidatus Saccharibacteria bacterium]